MKKCGLLIALLITVFTYSLRSQSPDKIDVSLWMTPKATECMIYFGSDPIETSHLVNKVDKGQHVYETLKQRQNKSQMEAQNYLEAHQISYKSYTVANCIYAKLQWEEIVEISEMNDVRQVVANGSLVQEQPQWPSYSLRDQVTWGIQMVKADSVWLMGIRGEGVVVAGEDTGVKWDLPSIENQYRGNMVDTVIHDYHWYDAIHQIDPMHGDSIPSPDRNPCGLNSEEPCDDHNHGSHTVGTMVGEDGEMKIGMAPEAQWIACRCMERGYGTLQTYVECFEFFLAPTDVHGENPRPEMAPDVINNSWGCPPMEGCNPTNFAIMEAAVNNLKSAGIVVVLSAGNSGSRCSSISNPAAIFENSFTVGATNSDDVITGFSSRGPVLVDGSGRTKPDVSAPGAGVLSQLRDSSYARWNGTSMAGPHVAGLVALVISANPNLRGDVETIEEIIKSTAVRKFQPEDSCDVDAMMVPNNTYGYGRIDALAAVKKALGLITTNSQDENGYTFTFNSLVKDVLTISWDGPIKTIRIMDLEGRHVLVKEVKTINSLKMDVSSLTPAMYLISTESGQGQTTQYKFVKQ